MKGLSIKLILLIVILALFNCKKLKSNLELAYSLYNLASVKNTNPTFCSVYLVGYKAYLQKNIITKLYNNELKKILDHYENTYNKLCNEEIKIENKLNSKR